MKLIPLQKTNNIYDENKTIKNTNKSYRGLVNYKLLLKANPNNWKGLSQTGTNVYG